MLPGKIDNSFREASGILRPVEADWEGEQHPDSPFSTSTDREYDYVSPDGRWEKRIHTSKSGTLLWEHDVHYTGVKFIDDQGQQDRESVSVHYDYQTGQYHMRYYGRNAGVLALLVRVPGSDVTGYVASVRANPETVRDAYQKVVNALK